jgi:ABC-type sugar transport system substrate-binding protein
MGNVDAYQRSTTREIRQEDAAPTIVLTEEEKAANDPTKKLVLFCSSNLNDPFQRVQSELMRVAVRTLEGYRYKVADAAGDISRQAEQIRQSENEKPVWLIVQPLDDRLIASLVESQHAAGTHIISLDQRIADQSCDSVIFTDQHKLGKLAGDVVVEALRRKAKSENQPTVTGRIVEIRGPSGSYEAKARAEGFAEAIHAEPGIIVIHEADGDWNTDSATRITKQALALQHQFDVVFAHNDSMARAASEALVKAQTRESALIVGIDGVGAFEGGIDLLRRGILDATIWQPMPMESAFLHIQKTAKEPKTPLTPRIEREPIAVTPQTLEAFSSKLSGAR